MQTETVHTPDPAAPESEWPTVRIRLSQPEESRESLFVQIERHCPMARGQRCLVLAPAHEAVSAFLSELNGRIERLNPGIETRLARVETSGSAAEVAAFVQAAQLGIRQGRHAALVLDSLNALAAQSADSLEACKRLFGAAQATAGAGTLTIVAVAIDPASAERDKEILRQFQGTGNMELALAVDRSRQVLSVNASRSGTKHAERIGALG